MTFRTKTNLKKKNVRVLSVWGKYGGPFLTEGKMEKKTNKKKKKNKKRQTPIKQDLSHQN